MDGLSRLGVIVWATLCGATFAVAAETVDINGVVTDGGGSPVAGAIVELIGQSMADTTDSSGAYSLQGTAPVVWGLGSEHGPRARMELQQGTIALVLPAPQKVAISVTNVQGRVVYHVPLRATAPGRQVVGCLPRDLSAGTYLFDLEIDGGRTQAKVVIAGSRSAAVLSERATGRLPAMAKRLSAVVDSVRATHPDFEPVVSGVAAYQVDLDINMGTPWWKCTGYDSSDGVFVHVLWPNGGDTLYVGDTVNLRFCSEDPEAKIIVRVDPALSLNGGRYYNRVNSGHIEGNQIVYDLWKEGNRVYWVVPETIYDEVQAEEVSTVSNQCRLQHLAYDDPNDHDESDEVFTIMRRD